MWGLFSNKTASNESRRAYENDQEPHKIGKHEKSVLLCSRQIAVAYCRFVCLCEANKMAS